MMKKLLLILNNITGNNRNAGKTFDIVKSLSKHGYEVTVFPVFRDSDLDIQEYLKNRSREHLDEIFRKKDLVVQVVGNMMVSL